MKAANILKLITTIRNGLSDKILYKVGSIFKENQGIMQLKLQNITKHAISTKRE